MAQIWYLSQKTLRVDVRIIVLIVTNPRLVYKKLPGIPIYVESAPCRRHIGHFGAYVASTVLPASDRRGIGVIVNGRSHGAEDLIIIGGVEQAEAEESLAAAEKEVYRENVVYFGDGPWETRGYAGVEATPIRRWGRDGHVGQQVGDIGVVRPGDGGVVRGRRRGRAIVFQGQCALVT